MVETKKIMWMFKKDLIVYWRHKPRLAMLIIFPLLMITIFGYSMGGTIDNVPVVVVEQSHGKVTDATLNAIKGMSLYDVKDVITDPDKGKQMVQSGQVKAAIILPSNYDNLKDTKPKSVLIDMDSSQQMAASAIIPATQALVNQISNQVGIQKLQGMNLTPSASASAVQVQPNQVAAAPQGLSIQSIMDSINTQINKLYGNIRYIDFLVPAALAMTVMFSCMFGMGESLAGERERGELTRLFMTPTSVTTVVAGKIISKMTTETVRAMILLIAAIVLFGTIINGSIILIILLLILVALCFVGFGIMISARVSTQEDYMQAIQPVAMPMMFISGMFFPIETMPWIFQKLSYFIPLTYANDAIRAVMLKGAGIGDIWVDVAVLLGFTALFFILGVTRFNRDV